MKTLVEIPEADLEAARLLTGAQTAEEAISTAVSRFVRTQHERRAIVLELYGSIPDIMSQEDLRRLRGET